MIASKRSVQELESRIVALEKEVKSLKEILYYKSANGSHASNNGVSSGTRRRKLSPERAAYYFEVEEEEILHLAATGKVPYILRDVEGALVPFFSGVELEEVLGKKPNHGRSKRT